MSSKEFWNYYPIKLHYLKGTNNLETDLTRLLGCIKIKDKFYEGKNLKVNYLELDAGKYKIEYKRDTYNAEHNSRVVSHRLVIGVRHDIDNHINIIKTLEKELRKDLINELH
jgi:hypothetical protein